MKQWHNYGIVIGLLAVIGMATPACTTLDEPSKINHMAATAKVAAYTGTALYLLEKPDDREKFEKVANTLDSLILNGQIDPVAFHTVMMALPIKELKSDKATIIVGAAMVLWENYKVETVELDKTVYVLPVITAVRDGIRQGLTAVPKTE